MIRIANGQGFWGGWLEAPVRLVEQGPLDYLTLDHLAEVTLAIQRQGCADVDRRARQGVWRGLAANGTGRR